MGYVSVRLLVYGGAVVDDRLATSGTGAGMQQIADAAYNALTVGEDRV